MIDTLKNYCEDHTLNTFDKDVCLSKIKTQDDVYYDICYWIIYLFLKASEQKKRCLLLHGAPNSGKTTIAKYLAEIFISYDYRQTNSSFDELITLEASRVQLLVIDECNGSQLFSKKELEDTKHMLEGAGKLINNKQRHAFRAFMNCYTIITMNNLPYPFT